MPTIEHAISIEVPGMELVISALHAALDEIERLGRCCANKMLENTERDAWKENALACGKMLQSFTPGGSEYFGKRIGDNHFATDEKACGAIIRSKIDALHEVRRNLMLARSELSRVKAERDEAVRLLRSTVAPMAAYPQNGSNAAEVLRRGDRIESFLSRMEGK